MNYLCLFYIEERKLGALPAEELVAGGLQPVATAMTVRVRNGTLSTTDGPVAETNEQLGGFSVIEARDLNDAIRVASKLPPARLGSIEVRPIAEPARP